MRPSFFKSFVMLSLLSVVALSACKEKQEEETILFNMPYHEARNILLQDFIPTSEFQNKVYKEDKEKYGYEHPFLKLGYTELGNCTGMGRALCDFYFTNGKGGYLRVITEGEDDGPGSNVQTRVVYIGVGSKEEVGYQEGKSYWDVILDDEGRANFEAMKEIIERNAP